MINLETGIPCSILGIVRALEVAKAQKLLSQSGIYRLGVYRHILRA